jgi:hypothetical protein
MAQPVWVLSVDLTTKTASFQTGMADAAKTARGAFSEISGGASHMAGETGGSMREAREGVRLLGEEFGIKLPRALSSFIAELGPMGAAMEAAFPFLAIAALAGILVEHLHAMHEAGEKLTDDQLGFGTAINNTFNALDAKLLQSQLKTDELRNDHMGALRLQLEQIDKTSLEQLVHSFDEVAKAADGVMKDLQGHWYEFGKGSDGADHALKSFKQDYDNLISQGKGDEASGLLKGTLDQALKVQAALKTYKENSGGLMSGPKEGADYGKALQAYQVLHAAKLSGTEKEAEAQNTLVEALQAQMAIEGKVAALKKNDQGNAKLQSGNEAAGQRAAAARQAAETQMRVNEQTITSEKATADSLLAIHHASIEERLASDYQFAQREREAQMAGNAAEIAALDKSGKDYTNQLKGLKDKQLEITSDFNAKVAALNAKASIEINGRDLQAMQEGEREKISATQEGSSARLAAIDAGIREEQAANIKDTGFIRDLMNQRVQTVAKMAEEEAKLKAEAAKEEASNSEKMGELQIAAEKSAQALADSSHRVSARERVAEETKTANEEYQLKMKALDKKISGLDKSGKDYNNKLKQLQDQEKQQTQQHENQLTEIKEKAEQERNQRILSAETSFQSSIASSLTKSLMGHQTWAKTLESTGNQVVSGMIENAIKSMLADDMTKEKDAAAAARKAYVIGTSMGGPAGIILGPVMAAAAFAGVMAFEDGGVVPGVGRGDVVPAMLTPGEGVVPKGVMEGLSNMARNGGFDQQRQSQTHVHIQPTYHVQTIDGDGMRDALEKHNDQLHAHFNRSLRKMNR